MAGNYSTRPSGRSGDYHDPIPDRRQSSYSLPRRRRSAYEWDSDDSYTYEARPRTARYYSSPPPSVRPGTTRPTSRNTYYDSNDSEDDYKSVVESTTLTEEDSGLTFEEVESEGLSKTFIVPKSPQATSLPLNFHASTAHPEWSQHEFTFDDGSVSRLFSIHASEYSLNKDGWQKIRLMCPDRPPPAEPCSSGVQFRWLHIQRQLLRLDDLNKLVINSPYISNELRVVALNVLGEVKSRASRKLVGGPYVESGSILRGTSSYDADKDSQNQPVMFISSPYLLLSQKPSFTDVDKGQRMFSLLESLYGYDVESDRQDNGLMKRMGLDPSKGTPHVPQLWCLLVGNDVLITLSELPVQELTKGLIEIDQRISSLRRPLTVRVLDQYRRPHSVVIDADCTYVDFLRHTFALAKEGTGTCVTDYELLDEDRDLVTPQEWLTLIQQGKLQDTIFYIVPRFQLQQQQQMRESRSRSRSRSQLRAPQREMLYDDHLAIIRGRRPLVTRRSRSRSRVVMNEVIRRPVASSREWITEDRTMSPEPRPGYDPEKWALVRYQQNSSRDNSENPGELAKENNTGRKLITWKDEVGDERDNNDEEESKKWPTRMESTSQHRPYADEDMQVVLRRPTEYMSRTSSGMSDGLVYRRRDSGHSRSRQRPRPRRGFSYEDISPPRGKVPHMLDSRRVARSNDARAQRRYSQNGRYISREQRIRSPTREPNIIINDAAYDSIKPNIFSLGDLPDDRQNQRSSPVSSDTESDYKESEMPRAMPSSKYDIGVGRGRRSSTHSQRQGWYKASDGVWRQGDSPRSYSESSDAGSSDTDTTSRVSPERYPKKGKTKIPAKLVSIRAIIDLGYPFVHEGDMIVLQRALDHRLIDELIKLSEEYKTAESKRDESTVRFEHPWSESSQSRSRSRGSVTRTPESGAMPKIRLLPFFYWKMRPENDSDIATNSDVILVEMLAKSDQQLRSDKLYNKIYACTLDDLLHRHNDFIKVTIPPSEPSTQDRKPSVVDMQEKGKDRQAPMGPDSNSEKNIHANKTSDDKVPDTRATLPINPTAKEPRNIQDEEKESVRLLATGEAAMNSLLELSQELLGTFLPKEGSAPFQRVCKRFWGSLDEMFRHIIWSLGNGSDQAHWVIHNFTPNSTLSKALPRAPTNKKTFADCEDCKMRKTYDSHAEALDHLHSEHLSCTSAGKSKKPYDDPCFVWLRRSDDSEVDQAQSKNIINAVHQFIELLTNVKDLAMELHYLVATTSHQSSESKFRPFLPSGIFYAFQQILSMYFLTSKQLSFINGLDSLQSSFEKRQTGPYWRKIRSLESDAQAAFVSACELLENSKEDIILSGIATQSPDTLGIESVGPHFLAASLAVNIQNRPLLPDTDTDVLQVYHEYTSKLRYQTYRRPRRRVFLDIHRLQEDLEALHNVVLSQIQVLDNYKRLLSPTSFRVTDTSREGLFRIESRYIDSHMDKLQDQNEEIRVQRERMKFLKEQVKQTIEILEENHGKAIRVFTIVTVFFLPLSFVSSFFGMNTTDIRDTEYDQRFFWTVALPVTFVVLALAFFYGYKGDTIEDRILTLLYDKNERIHRESPKKTVTWGTVTSESNPTRESSRYHLPSWVRPVRRRRTVNNAGVKRRTTDISYLSI
ncbi:uncharacterized protein GGS22DRAFT_194936 [Annulohypoxylon maeteangense]|uniref:uncharacterized protein n=1 Tax=Annulohypoxylon maeteangense TaxID=1927788 RepID=UPI0020072540|nr:uncharacterized protein GGS22DRAFT_194936 [Annulohypoxylon maeteangense]KAI0883680.1 hypothetical protein GGS22DRAFT_194936 [Annulohypoxylon maeteangense]